MQRNFYAELPLFTRFEDVTHAQNYAEVPSGWWVLIGDVVGSTQAIEAGRYKEVNVVGASIIIAVLNAADDIELPYSFGGDGAALLVPEAVLVAAKDALRGTRRMARDSFHLELLIAAIPVEDIRRGGKNVRVAKFGAARNFAQSMFNGGGIAEAERMAKDTATRGTYEIAEEAIPVDANFSGLECRWQGIPARSGETISLLVQVHRDAGGNTRKILDGVLGDIGAAYGGGSEAQPVSPEQLQLCLSSDCAAAELGVRAYRRGALYKAMLARLIRLQSRLAGWMMALRLRVAGVEWGNYRRDVVAHTDYRKFDDTLRMVLDSTPEQRARYTKYRPQAPSGE